MSVFEQQQYIIMRPIDIDGAALEGGGQVLRVALALATVLNKPVRVHDIRGKRPKPGLCPQHVAAVRLVADLFDSAHVEGCFIRSTELSFYPSRNRSSCPVFDIDVGTAGSCSLVLQAALPVLLLASSLSATEVIIRGGTDVSFSPPWTWITNVLFSLLRRFAGDAGSRIDDARLVRRGYCPDGGGEVCVRIKPASSIIDESPRIGPIRLDTQGKVIRLRATVFGNYDTDVKREVSGALLAKANERLVSILNDVEVEVQEEEEMDGGSSTCSRKSGKKQPTSGSGGVFLAVETDTGCVLGASSLIVISKRDMNDFSRRVAIIRSVVDGMVDDLAEDFEAGACVDRHAQDQLIVFMALSEGPCRMVCTEPSLHTLTAISVSERLTKKRFRVTPPSDRQSGHAVTARGGSACSSWVIESE